MTGNTIIYPTDFSPCAENALNYVIQMAKATKSSVEIVHEIDISSGYSASMISTDALSIVSMMEDEAKVKMKQLQEQLLDEGIKSNTQIIIGNKMMYYLKEVKTDGSLMLVMGTKGSSSIENIIFGSITHKVIREVNFPVLVVPIDAPFEGISEIVFATDYSEMNMKQFKTVTELGAFFHSNIRAVHVSDGTLKPETEASFLADFEKTARKETDYQLIDFQLLFAKSIEERLHTMIQEDGVDLLVLVTQKQSFFDRFFGQSLTKKMVYHTQIPMLVFNKK
jgi:nucleotide-binding universal stress UspA family protein